MDVKSTSSYASESSPVLVNSDPVSDMNNVRLRHMKSNIPIPAASQPTHIIMSTGDSLLDENDNDANLTSRNKHQKSQLIILVFTALSYLLHTLRSLTPEHSLASSHFWSVTKPLPIVRNYTSHFRPSLFLENVLLRSAEISQTLWLIYILSFIPRRSHLGYLYRNPNIFNSLLYSLLISAAYMQTISQAPLPPEISCACLWISFILLIISCRLIAMVLIKYEEKLQTFDLFIIRYFVLNSLFLYTTSVAYLTICSSIECFAFHLDPNVQSISTTTTIGLLILLIFLLIYYFLDRFVYENEFRSIWTPYLFFAIGFHCPPLRKLSSDEPIPSDWNFYLLWAVFSITVLLLFIRIGQQILPQYRQFKRKSLRLQLLKEKSLETENQ